MKSIEVTDALLVTDVIRFNPEVGNPVLVAPVRSIVPLTSSVAPEAMSISADAGI